MALPIIQIYSRIDEPGEANNYAAYSQDRFQADLAMAVASGESAAQVRINSVGGNWVMAQGIFGMIKASALKIDTYCDGIAASSASLVFMAGRKRLISAHARLMIHNCSGPAFGQVGDLEKAIEGQKAINESMASIYANATGIPIETIREMMAAETWLDADTAVAKGFATGTINNDKKAAAPPADMPTESTQAALLQWQAYYAEHLPVTPTSLMKDLLLPILQANAVAHISAASSDADVTAAVSAAFTENKQLKDAATGHATALSEATAATSTEKVRADAAEAKLKEQEDAAAETERTAAAKKVTDLVTAAVGAGKITADLVPHFTQMATASLAACTAVLDKMPAKQSLLQITASADGAGVGRITAAAAMAEISAKK